MQMANAAILRHILADKQCLFCWAMCEVSVFGVLLVRNFPHLDWIRRDTEYLFVFSPNAENYGQEKLRIWTLFTQWHWFPCEIIQNFLVNSVSLFISSYLSCCMLQKLSNIWGEVFKNRRSKIYGRQPLKNLKWYGLAQTLLGLILNTFSHMSYHSNKSYPAKVNTSH